MNGDQHRPLGHQYALAMLNGGEESVRKLATTAGTQLTLDAFLRVQDEEPVPAFLHSALCAMSLPTKRPKDDTQPIVREDGKYALAINPRPVLQNVDGKSVMRSLGVPYGAYPRVALIYLLSQAVMKQSRDVYLGRNFTEWMRRLGYQTVSYGPRGTANLMREQVDRLLACEWQIRWDGTDTEDNASAVRDVKISNEYAGSLDKNGSFAREIRMSEAFYTHLIDHAVPSVRSPPASSRVRQRRSISTLTLPTDSRGLDPTRARLSHGTSSPSTLATRPTASASDRPSAKPCRSCRRSIPTQMSISPGGRSFFIRHRHRWSASSWGRTFDSSGARLRKRHRDHRSNRPMQRSPRPRRTMRRLFRSPPGLSHTARVRPSSARSR